MTTAHHIPPCIYSKATTAVLVVLVALMSIFCVMVSRASDRATEASRKAESLTTDMQWVKATLIEIKGDVKDLKRGQ